MGSRPIPVVKVDPGVVVPRPGVAGAFDVNVGGARPAVWWPAGYIPTSGDAVRVLLVDGQAMVLGPVIGGQRPGQGTVSGAASSGTVPVDTVAGTLAARYTGTAPSIGDEVFLDWQMSTPRLLPGVASSVPTPPDPVEPDAPAPPPPTQGGMLSVTALDSATWSSAGAWDSYYGTAVVQGSYSGRSYSGAWFYGDQARQLAGRTFDALRIRLGARRHMGNYNSPLDLQLWLHGNPGRPGGDVSRLDGPFAVTLAPGAGAQWVAIPAAWAHHMANNGGGIGVTGGSYGGVTGIGEDPASGQLQIDWRA